MIKQPPRRLAALGDQRRARRCRRDGQVLVPGTGLAHSILLEPSLCRKEPSLPSIPAGPGRSAGDLLHLWLAELQPIGTGTGRTDKLLTHTQKKNPNAQNRGEAFSLLPSS